MQLFEIYRTDDLNVGAGLLARLNVDNLKTYFSIIFYILEMTVVYFLFLDSDDHSILELM